MITRKYKKTAALLLSGILALPAVVPAHAENRNTDPAVRYMAFASDVQGDPQDLVDALSGFPAELEYISILGDMVGTEADPVPEYHTSEFFAPIFDMFEDIRSRSFNIVWGEHDKNAIDDSDVLHQPSGTYSEENYAMGNLDGSTECYVYGVGFYDMTDGAVSSYDSAQLFKHWLRKKDPTIPVIVVCHAPLEVRRGDNYGAVYWNEALNYAATGVEGITGTDHSYNTIRNVIFLCGHNDTVDPTEYIYPAGSVMKIQGDPSGFPIPDAVTNEAYGEDSKIYYTAYYPGYIGLNHNASLLSISDESIVISKYHNGDPVSLGTNGETGEVFGDSYQIARIQKSDEGGPVIAVQPEDVVVSYPEGASFTVVPENPDEIASYQWYVVDIEDSVSILDGFTGTEPTLVVPSTLRADNDLRFYCVLTNKEGLRTVSDSAVLTKDNREENKPVFYVGEYAVEPGETLDLSAVDIGHGYKLGSGTLEFSENAKDIILTDLHYDNGHMTAGLPVCGNVALNFEFNEPDQEEYIVTCSGDNRIMNHYYNYEYNVGGIPFDFYFTGDADRPAVNFVGDGTLHITNGYNALRVIGDLLIDMDITVEQDRPEYADGIAARNMLVSPGVTLNLDVNGAALTADNNLFIDQADINITSSTPRFSVGASTKRVLNVGGTILIDSSTVDMGIVSDESICGSTGGCGGMMGKAEIYITNGSEVNCEASFIGDSIFAAGFTLLNSHYVSIDHSKVGLVIDGKQCVGAIGIYSEEDAEIAQSELDIDVRASGDVYAVRTGRDFNADDCVINASAGVYDRVYEGSQCIGLACENAVFRASAPQYRMSFTGEDLAAACDLKKPLSETPAGYDEEYEYTNFFLRDETECLVPEDSAISIGSIELSPWDYALIETVYDKADTSRPVTTAVFGLRQEETAVYTVTMGDGSSWKKGSAQDLEFIVSRDPDDAETFNHFLGVKLDGEDLDPSAYTAEAGSVVIRLKASCLETLAVGKHTLTAVFDDGEAAAEFTILAKEEEKPVTPGTGDGSGILLWGMIFISALAGVILTMRKRIME